MDGKSIEQTAPLVNDLGKRRAWFVCRNDVQLS
jgi:hypothetical protein